jgi:hypothetical protein
MLRGRRLWLLYSPAVDPFLEDLMMNADRAFYFDEGPRAVPKIVAKALPKTQRDQTHWRHFLELAVSSMAAKTRSQDYFG